MAGPSSWLLWPAGAVVGVVALLLGHLAGATIGSAPGAYRTTAIEQRTAAPELSLEEPFTLLPDSEETLSLLAFGGDEVGP